ncbi:MAG: hypothetical protein ABEJ31_09780 [Haloarculaceae archaeon]
MFGSGDSRKNGERTDTRPTGSRVTRYDLLLAIVPLAFLASVLLGLLLPIGDRTALAGALAIGVLALADALFMNPPRSAGGQ